MPFYKEIWKCLLGSWVTILDIPFKIYLDHRMWGLVPEKKPASFEFLQNAFVQ